MHRRVLADHSLACRLERAEGLANAHYIDVRARLMPGSGAKWIEVAGAYAMYDGSCSPCTQTFGLGLLHMPTASDMDQLEAFFKDRKAPVLHEVCPLADKALLPLLSERGYRPVELSQAMFLPLGEDTVPGIVGNQDLTVRIVRAERDLWVQTAVEGWHDSAGSAELIRDLMRASAEREDCTCFLVESEGRSIASGALVMRQGIALLAGASTVPAWRGRGAQQVLLGTRLQYALRAGCDLAMVCAEPGSASQRNSERQGFQIAYTRIKWRLSR
jgi:GNAT superfamily N-acetyltransferase